MATPEPNGTIAWRVGALERGHERLDEEKADIKDVDRLAEEFARLRTVLMWFMGIVGSALVAMAVLIIQRAAGG